MNPKKPVSANRRINRIFMKIRNSTILLVAVAAAAALISVPAAFARAPIKRAATHPVQPAASVSVRPVLENYIKIQTALAQDSLQGVTESAAAIADAVRSDPGKTFPQRLARQADRLARAKNLTSARDAFLRVSPHLIDYVKKNHLAGFYLGYCRMQRVAWLQADSTIANPYMGKAMPRCAWFRKLNG
jgi:hypothetical protein